MPGLSKFPLSKVFNYNLFCGVFSSSQLVIICLCLLQTVGEIEKEKVCVCVCERERERVKTNGEMQDDSWGNTYRLKTAIHSNTHKNNK